MSNETDYDDRGLDHAARPDVAALASTVISLLSDRTGVNAPPTTETVVAHDLLRAVLADGIFDPEGVLHHLKGNQLDVDAIIDRYIPGCARELGKLWDEDRISFAKVTIGCARLQTLLAHLAPPWTDTARAEVDLPSVLIILLERETHTLAPHLVAAQLRRMGASVRIEYGLRSNEFVDRLNTEDFDLVLFSCSHANMLESVEKLVNRIRTDCDQVPPIALGGAVINHVRDVKGRTGVDLVSSDVRVAYRLCEKLKRRA